MKLKISYEVVGGGDASWWGGGCQQWQKLPTHLWEADFYFTITNQLNLITME